MAIQMMVVGSMLPFLALFGAAIKLSSEPPNVGQIRIPGAVRSLWPQRCSVSQ